MTSRSFLRAVFCFLVSLLGGNAVAVNPPGLSNVFIIMMENHDWVGSDGIKGSPNCPYINNTLLPMASYCEQYYNPPNLHPSEPNYIWLEAGTNFGILDDDPDAGRITSTNHLVTYLFNKGISWRTYAEDIEPGYCPVTNRLNYRVRHTPAILFRDVITNEAYCANHVVPYQQLWSDLTNNSVARYNFLVPNKTNDMHDAACSGCSTRSQGDYWLSHEIPKITNSAAYKNGGLIVITWDEGDNSSSDGPIGCILLSAFAKGGGYANSIHYTHSSLLRTVQDIFGVHPYLGDAANALDLSDLFKTPTNQLYLLSERRFSNGTFAFRATNLVVNKTTYFQASEDLAAWTTLRTNVPAANNLIYTDTTAPNYSQRFYRIAQEP